MHIIFLARQIQWLKMAYDYISFVHYTGKCNLWLSILKCSPLVKCVCSWFFCFGFDINFNSRFANDLAENCQMQVPNDAQTIYMRLFTQLTSHKWRRSHFGLWPKAVRTLTQYHAPHISFNAECLLGEHVTQSKSCSVFQTHASTIKTSCLYHNLLFCDMFASFFFVLIHD